MSGFRHWWRDVFRRRQADAELDEEIRYHIDRDVETHVAAGLSEAEARQRALAEFGAVAAIKEEVGETRVTRLAESVWLDVRYGARSLRRNPLFTSTAVVTLALTIAAVTTLLTVAHSFFLRPLPVDDPDSVVEVVATRGDMGRTGFVSYPDYVGFRDGAGTLRGLAATYMGAPLFVTSDEEALALSGSVVTANFFPLLGLEPALGRFFRPDEDAVPGRDAVVVMAYELWVGRYGADPGVIGRTLEINGVVFTVIGVAPVGFHGIGTTAPQIYMPAMMLSVGYRWCSVLEEEDCTILRMFGRLRDGVGIDAARGELAAQMPERWRGAPPGENSGVNVVRVRGAEIDETTRRFLELLGAVSAALLAVCCANLAGLLTSRTGARARELAIRTSLGAPRARLMRQMLTEAVLLAVGGGTLGTVLSLGLTRVLASTFYTTDSSGRPYFVDLSISPAVVVAVLGLAILCGLLFGVLPALTSVRLGSAAGTLRRSAAHLSGGGRLGTVLVGGQAAAAVAFVVIAAVLTASSGVLLEGVNFDPEDIALLRMRPRLVDYEPERAQTIVRRAIERLEDLPNVASATMVGTGVALRGLRADVGLPGVERALLESGYIEIGPRYFETMRTPLLRGREFFASDDASAAPVAVVNEALATAVWPDGEAMGRELIVEGRRFQVVGVVADVQLQNRGEAPQPYVYTPYWQNPESVDARLQVRVSGDAAAALPRLMREVARVDPSVPLTEPWTLEQRVAGWLRPLRMGAAAVSYAGGLAVLLSALGLYAALAAGVTARNQEFGVRMAVGARAADVFRMIIGQGAVVIVAGVGAGLVLATGVVRLMSSLLYGPSTGDGALFVAAGLAVCGCGLVASLVPAMRAARTSPIRAMRPR